MKDHIPVKETIDYEIISVYAVLYEQRRKVMRELPRLHRLLVELHARGAHQGYGPLRLEFRRVLRARRSWKAFAAHVLSRVGEELGQALMAEFLQVEKAEQWRVEPRPNPNYQLAPVRARGTARRVVATKEATRKPPTKAAASTKPEKKKARA